MRNEASESPAYPAISPGAAMAHGCCGAFRPPPLRVVDTRPPPSESEAHSTQKQVMRNAVLSRLRQDQGLVQQELAERLAVSQACVAGMEQKQDMLLSTLRRYVRALGGELELIARFPDVSYHLGDKPR